jgi:RimJ/RimL family protein N-acetyltransferase
MRRRKEGRMVTFEKARSGDTERLAQVSKLAFDHDIVEGKQIIGGIIILRKGVREYEVGRIYIEPEFQDQGIGTEAFQFLWDAYPLAKRWTLGTPGWNKRTQHFYKKVGFVEIGRDRDGGVLYERVARAGVVRAGA